LTFDLDPPVEKGFPSAWNESTSTTLCRPSWRTPKTSSRNFTL